MTRDKLLELARTAGGYDGFTSAPSDWDSGDVVISPEQLERFAALVAAAERESLRAALSEIRDRLVDHPSYQALTEEQEEEIGGDTAELSYLVRVADAAIQPQKGDHK